MVPAVGIHPGPHGIRIDAFERIISVSFSLVTDAGEKAHDPLLKPQRLPALPQSRPVCAIQCSLTDQVIGTCVVVYPKHSKDRQEHTNFHCIPPYREPTPITTRSLRHRHATD